MSENTRSITVEVPHRISGFFEIVDEIDGIRIIDPEKIGSRGAGFNLSAVGKTKIVITPLKEFEENSCKIYINDEELNYYLNN